jgi:iron complex outermembrane receptor protein
VGYAPVEQKAFVADGALLEIEILLEAAALRLGEIVVEGASRVSETLLDAPAAVAVATPEAVRAAATAGEMPRAFINMPGVDVIQGDLGDVKVNARGFMPSTVRTVLVLQDGRDLSMPFLGQQQWNALSLPPDDAEAIEFVRGPGSAIYGPNAFSGVINIITPEARDVIGTKIRMVGGGLSTRQGDVRHAGLLVGERLGYRVNVGYSRSQSWSRSRTRFDRLDFMDEYAPATDSAIPPVPPPERTALNGQSIDSLDGAATGTPDDLVSLYGSARVDWYVDSGTTATADGGIGRIQNTVSVIGSGRVQQIEDIRPWARANLSAPDFSASVWYTGRVTHEPQVVLGSGARQEDASGLFQGETQYRTSLLAQRLRIVTGASARVARIDSKGTLFLPVNDNRSDWSFGAYGQAEYALTSGIHLIGALRWDQGDLFDGEITPRVGVLWRPGGDHALRLTLNRAFLTPSHAELFLHLPAGFRPLAEVEEKLRASSVASALEAVPEGKLFTNSAAVPVFAINNPDLVPQKVTSLELGYRGQLSRRTFVTLDTYLNRKNDLVTGLLPATTINPTFLPWTAPTAVAPEDREAVEEAVQSALKDSVTRYGLTRLPDGTTAVVLSNGNAGLVVEWGIEIGIVGRLTEEIVLSGNYAYYGYDIREQHAGDVLQPNTPRHKGGASLACESRNGVQVQLSVRANEGYQFSQGVWRGYVPGSITADLSTSLRLARNVRLNAVATDLFDRQQFESFGSAVVGRRILAGVTLTF